MLRKLLYVIGIVLYTINGTGGQSEYRRGKKCDKTDALLYGRTSDKDLYGPDLKFEAVEPKTSASYDVKEKINFDTRLPKKYSLSSLQDSYLPSSYLNTASYLSTVTEKIKSEESEQPLTFDRAQLNYLNDYEKYLLQRYAKPENQQYSEFYEQKTSPPETSEEEKYILNAGKNILPQRQYYGVSKDYSNDDDGYNFKLFEQSKTLKDYLSKLSNLAENESLNKHKDIFFDEDLTSSKFKSSERPSGTRRPNNKGRRQIRPNRGSKQNIKVCTGSRCGRRVVEARYVIH